MEIVDDFVGEPLEAAALVVSAGAAVAKGKFAHLHEDLRERLDAEFEKQSKIAEATVQVATATTEILGKGLESAIGVLKAQIDRHSNGEE